MNDHIVPDSQHRGLIARLPPLPRDLAQLARFDRPIGWWLLFWPCVFGVWLAGAGWQLSLLGWLLLGAIAMRGAGCVYNDIVDAKLDASVARTAARPVASGRVSKRLAWGWLITLCLIGLVVLLQLRLLAQLVALASLVLVAAYPFMKRITWWTQAWLGLTFNWGAIVGFTAETGRIEWPMLALYAGCFFWTLGYDTIYAHQDREDDALIGVGSTARRLHALTKPWLYGFFGATFGLIVIAGIGAGLGLVFAASMLAGGAHMVWQMRMLDINKPLLCLKLFRSTRYTGALIAAAMLIGAATAL